MPKSKKKKNQRGGEDEQRQARLDEMAGLAAIFSEAFEQDDDDLGFKLHLVCLNRATANFASSVSSNADRSSALRFLILARQAGTMCRCASWLSEFSPLHAMKHASMATSQSFELPQLDMNHIFEGKWCCSDTTVRGARTIKHLPLNFMQQSHEMQTSA